MIAVAVGQASLGKSHRGHTLIKVVLLRPAIALPSIVQRLWWHTKAYSVSAGLLLLLGGSLVVLRLHSFYRNRFKRAHLSRRSHTSVIAHND